MLCRKTANRCLSSFAPFALAPNLCLSSFACPRSLSLLIVACPRSLASLCLSSFALALCLSSLPPLLIVACPRSARLDRCLSSFVCPRSSCLSSFALIRSHSLLIVACPRSLFWSSFARSSLSSFVLRSLSLPVLVRLATCPRSLSRSLPVLVRSFVLVLVRPSLSIVACPRSPRPHSLHSLSFAPNRCLSSFVLFARSSFVPFVLSLPVLVRSHDRCLSSFALLFTCPRSLVRPCPRSSFALYRCLSSFASPSFASFTLIRS